MGIDIGPVQNTDGLVLQIDAANYRSYSGTGLTSFGLISGIGGTLVNGVGFTTLNRGTFVFDGTNDFISIGSLGTFYTQGTISFLINFSDVSASIRNPFSTNYGTTNNVNVLRFETAEVSGSLRVWLGNAGGTFSGLYYSNVSTNVWYNVVFTWNQSNTTVSGYLNGVLDNSNTSWSNWPSTFANVGLGLGYSGRYFSGNIGQLQIYNRALTAQEILQNYNATKGRYGL
jgi:hypothetical protein